MQVQELMSQPVLTCRTDASLDAAAQVMWDGDCGAVVVVDDEGSLVGMITDRDCCMAAYTKGAPLSSIRVADAMAHQVFSADRHESLEAVERVMSEKQIRRIPIVDDDHHPVGILSINDIARHAVGSRTNGRLHNDVTRTLAAIGLPRSSAKRPQAETQTHSPAP